MSGPFPEEILPKHTAILGMTGSGKSTTARDLVEQVVAAGSRVCILDTMKSDWWGITSSADGKKPGLPFTILGGPKQHLPLNRNMGKAIAEVVASGALPLSIIDMVDFGMGDPSHFFVDFAEKLFRKTKGVLYLVIEEAHELAPKERVGFNKENLGVYWAKKLAIGARSRGLRLVVLTQRVQSLHNAVLGSCENVVVHRMTTPADQEPVVAWLKGNIKDKELRRTVEESMSSLPDGRGWLCSGSAHIFQNVQFPRAKTYDNTAAPTDDSELVQVKTAKVDTEQLRVILADAVKEAESNDVGILKKRIAELERAARAFKPQQITQPILDPANLRRLEVEAFDRGHQAGWTAGIKTLQDTSAAAFSEVTAAIGKAMTDKLAQVDGYVLQLLNKAVYYPKPENPYRTALPDGVTVKEGVRTERRGNGSIEMHTITQAVTREQVDQALYGGPISGVQQRIVDALAELEQMGAKQPPSELIAIMAGYTNLGSKGYRNALSGLRSKGLVKGLELTPAGLNAANPPPAPRNTEELQQQLINRLGGAAGRILTPLIQAYPEPMDKNELGQVAGYGNVQSKGFRNAMSQLRTLGFLDYPSSGTVVAKSVLFLQ